MSKTFQNYKLTNLFRYVLFVGTYAFDVAGSPYNTYPMSMPETTTIIIDGYRKQNMLSLLIKNNNCCGLWE